MPEEIIRVSQRHYGNESLESGYTRTVQAGASMVIAPGATLTSGGASAKLVSVLEQTVLKSAFTDGGSTVGTFVMGSIPAGSVILGTKVLVPAAWTGDTTAVMTIGDGSDVDRYNTGTIPLFTIAATGVQSGVPSGLLLLTAANTPTLTVTSTADFTNVVATASVTVSIYYIAA